MSRGGARLHGTIGLAEASSLGHSYAMIRVCRLGLSTLVALLSALALRAQTTVPATTQAIPPVSLTSLTNTTSLDLRNYFNIPGVTGTVVQLDTVVGKFNMEMYASDAPLSVANFLNYVNSGAFNNTIIHRSVPGFVIQGGGYRANSNLDSITRQAPIPLEYKLPNVIGSVAMARTSVADSATSEWFVNVADNTTILGKNGSSPEGYAVFARVIGTGMSVVNTIVGLPRTNLGDTTPFSTLPLYNYTAGSSPQIANLVAVTTATVIPIYPGTSGASVITFAVTSSAPTVATAAVSGSTLTVTPFSAGTATLTITATDTNGSVATSTAQVTVTSSEVPTAPAITTQPIAQTVASGSTVVFRVVATGLPVPTYQWTRNGAAMANATSSTLVISNATAANAGDYAVAVKNSVNTITSTAANLAINTATATEVGRLINLSVLTTTGTGDNILTVGASVGPLTSSESLPLLFRGVGPTLKTPIFGIATALDDPTMTINSLSPAAVIATNDDWGTGGAATLSATFTSVGAFPLVSSNSLDSAYASLTPGLKAGGYTVQVAAKGSATGTVIAEIYDASGSTRTATTPRLVNLSTRAIIGVGGDLRTGFVLNGLSARTILVRAVGPSLSAFGIGGVMADPKLELFDNDHGGLKLGENDNWGGDPQITAVSKSVGAFDLAGATTKDAVLLITLPAGAYSARLTGVGGSAGVTLVEVYEVP